MGAFHLERPLKNCKLKFEVVFPGEICPDVAGKTPEGLSKGSLPRTSLMVNSASPVKGKEKPASEIKTTPKSMAQHLVARTPLFPNQQKTNKRQS